MHEPGVRSRWRAAVTGGAWPLGVALLLAACRPDAATGPSPATASPASTGATGTSGAATGTATGTAAPADGAAVDGVGDVLFPAAGSAGIDMAVVDVALDWQPPEASRPARLDAEIRLTLRVTADRDGIGLDLNGPVVTWASVDGRPVAWTQRGGDLLLDPGRRYRVGAEHAVAVRYGGTPTPIDDGTGLGVQIGWHTDGQGADAVSFVAGEPVGASTWLAVNDHPSDKAVYRLAVTVPDPLEVVATGMLRDRVAGPRPGTTTWRFDSRDPVASYLVSVATGRFDVQDGAPGATGVALRHAFPEGTAAGFAPVFAGTGPALDTLAELFGPYPFEVYGALVVERPLGYALENQTLSLFDTATAEREAVQVHELAHQWFGNSVTPASWSDIWLNEGFSTYAETLWRERREPGFDVDTAMARARAAYADAGPIGRPPLEELFGVAVYQRGALTLHALRRTIGDEAFFTLVRRWTGTYRHATVTTADLVGLAEEVSGRELDAFFAAWLHDPVMPPLPA